MVMAIHVRHAQLRERRSAADKDVVHHPQPHRMRERILLLVGQPYISTESSRCRTRMAFAARTPCTVSSWRCAMRTAFACCRDSWCCTRTTVLPSLIRIADVADERAAFVSKPVPLRVATEIVVVIQNQILVRPERSSPEVRRRQSRNARTDDDQALIRSSSRHFSTEGLHDNRLNR